MRKTRFLSFVILLFFSIFVFTSCPLDYVVFMENHPKYLDFELSDNTIVPNIPVELTIRWCLGNLEDDEIFSIKRLDNLNMELIEGDLYNDSNNAIFVKFIQPNENSSSDNDDAYTLYPYCKLRMSFSEAGSYELRFLHTTEDVMDADFTGGYMYKVINVEEM